MTNYNSGATSASYATFEDVEILRRTVDAMQRHLAAHDEMFEANGRVLDAFDQSLRTAFGVIFILGAGVIAALIIGVIAVIQR